MLLTHTILPLRGGGGEDQGLLLSLEHTAMWSVVALKGTPTQKLIVEAAVGER